MDPWLIKLVERLRQARSREQLQAVRDDLEDFYDAFAGPGEELVQQLLEEARRRLAEVDPNG